jgi:hypothetical protein
MDIASIRITGLASLSAATLALLLAPICARADDGPNDRHEIPTFVLKRIELRRRGCPPGSHRLDRDHCRGRTPRTYSDTDQPSHDSRPASPAQPELARAAKADTAIRRWSASRRQRDLRAFASISVRRRRGARVSAISRAAQTRGASACGSTPVGERRRNVTLQDQLPPPAPKARAKS